MRPDAGVVRVSGTDVAFNSPATALAAGVTIMQQELSLATDLTVRENVLLGRHPSRLGFVSERRMRRDFDEIIERTGFQLDGGTRVEALPLAKQQEVEIVRALARGARVIIMDEPTAALSAQDGERLHAVVRSLRDSGVAVLYISHFLDEVLTLSDDVTIMRNGRHVRTLEADGATVDHLVEGMLGRVQEENFPELAPVRDDAPVVLELRDVRRRGQPTGIDLTVRAGEIVGLFGLVGSGRSELALAVFGAEGRHLSGEVRVDGEPVRLSSPGKALDHGVALLPESRKDQGLFLGMSQRRNTTMTCLSDFETMGVVRSAPERKAAVSELHAMGVDPVAPNGEVAVLSGGNQQKVLFAKTLLRRPRVLLLDEPTRGVDVGARRAIYDIVADLVAEGMAVVLISSEYDEVVNMSHRLCVMREGRIVKEFASTQVSHAAALAAAFGVSESSTFIKEVT
jgi:ABC-type sugar transport system ATPase subunit